MKLVPVPLPPVCASQGVTPAGMERLPPLPFSPTDLLWRYQLGLPPTPASPLLDFKTHLPAQLATDPRTWSRDDVVTFLRWCEREFDLQPLDMDAFRMNGKAMCLLTRADLAARCPPAGDLLHNVLRLLLRDAASSLPSSPLTPSPYQLSPPPSHHHNHNHHHQQQVTANGGSGQSQVPVSAATVAAAAWSVLQHDHFQNAAHAASLAHFMSQSNSVTLSPAPSVDSQSGSPHHADNANAATLVPKQEWHHGYGGHGTQSDSDEDSYAESSPSGGHSSGSPPLTPSAIVPQQPLRSPKKEMLVPSPSPFRPVAREFFPSDTPEPNTNGRLLWDFLQQLLNDPTQRYTSYIAWKNRDTGVFKIVDPAGLAKLWGIQKNHLSMNYDKMSRALRYYYRVNILRKVQGERHCYQFLRNPTELKNIKNISLLRQQMSPTQTNAPITPLTSAQNQNTLTKMDQQQQNIKTEDHETIQQHQRHQMEDEDSIKNYQTKTHHFFYQRSPADLKNTKNISIFQQQSNNSPSGQNQNILIVKQIEQQSTIKTEERRHNSADEDEEMPTDLSMVHHPTDLSSKSDKHRISILCAPEINKYSTMNSDQ